MLAEPMKHTPEEPERHPSPRRRQTRGYGVAEPGSDNAAKMVSWTLSPRGRLAWTGAQICNSVTTHPWIRRRVRLRISIYVVQKI